MRRTLRHASDEMLIQSLVRTLAFGAPQQPLTAGANQFDATARGPDVVLDIAEAILVKHFHGLLGNF